MRLPLKRPAELLHERQCKQSSSSVALQGDVLVVCWLHNVASKLELRSLRSGALRQEVSLPGMGSVRGFSGRREDSEMFFSYSSFTDPGRTFRCARAASAAIAPVLP